MKGLAIYPGSFDPMTVGHLDIITRAARLFDQVCVAVLHNPDKAGWLPVEERVRLLTEVCAELPNVTVTAWGGLLVELYRQQGASCVIRGLRDAGDFPFEYRNAQINHVLEPAFETLFMLPTPAHQAISSSAVRELMAFGGDIHGFVPPHVEQVLLQR